MDKIILLGATGFLGRHTLPILEEKYGKENVIGVSSKDYDLTNFSQCERMFNDIKPNIVVHFAVYSGGIGANKAYPADFYHINILLQANVFNLASKYGVKKMVYPMGGCSYPATSTSPIDESQMWNGYPQNESAGYSTAKMMGIVASKSYRAQYGMKTSVIIPGNMYGEYDNFICGDSHVIPAMIRRYYEAKINNLDEVIMWGTGDPQRDFVYAGDVAKTIPYFIDEYDSDEIVNISSGTKTSIKELAQTIKEFTGYQGAIKWDTEKPDGQMVKVFSTDKMKLLGLSCDTKLLDGIKNTSHWLEKNYEFQSDKIRLGTIDNEPILSYFDYFIKSNFIVLDIGCNDGRYAKRILSNLGNNGFLYSFEANPEMTKNILSSITNDNFKLINKAVFSKDNEILPFYIDTRENLNAVASSLNKLDDLHLNKTIKTINVSTVTLDTFCNSNSIKPDFIKIDVEGAEIDVFMGAHEIINKHRPIIVFEFWETWWEKSVKNIFDYLRNFYIMKDIKSGKVINDFYYNNAMSTSIDVICLPKKENINKHMDNSLLLYTEKLN